MIRNRLLLRSIAVFMVIETLFSTVAPTISWALTSGPTAPEATSFEPVDTTDIVNLATGDLVYNVPLLEVPGPAGGYPLSLSYHPGIQTNEDASWVGLGFSLSPGAISRNVNGYADDFKDAINTTRLYWSGGSTTTYSAGVSIGLTGVASVSADLSYSQDTYQGSGIGFSVGVGVGLTKNDNGARADVSMGVSPYGDPYASAGLSVGPAGSKEAAKSLGLSGGVGISTNFKSVGGYASAGVSYGNKDGRFSVLGASMSTGSRNGIGASIGGASYFQNSKAGRISTTSSGATISFPVYAVWINLGYSHRRYWIDQTDAVQVNGALAYPTALLSHDELNKKAFDTYSLVDLDTALVGGIVENGDPEKTRGGSFPNFDDYSVHAQGLGGSIRPYLFQKHLVKRNDVEEREDNDGDPYKHYESVQYQTGFDQRRAEFRFTGDFSNKFIYNAPAMKKFPEAGHTPVVNPLSFDFQWGGDPLSGDTPEYEYTTNRVPGSRHIEWLTNQEILSNAKPDVGLMDTRSTGFNRPELPENGIGAFVITNESGVRYHFALPAMNVKEYSYSENVSKSLTFNETSNNEPYAYTWYLTAVTGPDYIDRGPTGSADGILNEFDFGYWVEFDYGKWTDMYFWRNPSEGMNPDLDSDFKNFSEGRKELYFLDAIRTKTHTAIFVKEIRHDAKSTIYSLRNITDRGKKNKETLTSITKNGGFTPKNVFNTCDRNPIFVPSIKQHGSIAYTTRPTSSLKLRKILLLENEDFGNLDKSRGDAYAQNYSYNWSVTENSYSCPSYAVCQGCDFSNLVFKHHLYQNVFDIYDLDGLDYEEKALRIVALNSDYALTPGTANSFDFADVKGPTPSTNDAMYARLGKLTLQSVKFLGKGGSDMMPPLQFSYEPRDAARGHASIYHVDNTPYFKYSNSGLSTGDIIKFFNNSYAVVVQVDGITHKLKLISGLLPTQNAAPWQLTKNPPYNKDRYDQWGLYKSDLDESSLIANERAARLVSTVSAVGTDVWSMRTVKTTVGSEIDIHYEPDAYRRPVLTNTQQLSVASIEPKPGTANHLVTLYDEGESIEDALRATGSASFSVLLADPYLRHLSKRFRSRIEIGRLLAFNVTRNSLGKIVFETSLAAIFATRPDDDGFYQSPIFISGNLSLFGEFENQGGGLRVKSIKTYTQNVRHETAYFYNRQGVGGTSGVTSYTPGGLDQAVYHFPATDHPLYEYFDWPADVDKAKKKYKKILYKDFYELLAHASEIPAPGVVYEYVTTKRFTATGNENYIQVPEYSTAHFEVFNRGMVGTVYSNDHTYEFDEPVPQKVVDGAYFGTHKIRTKNIVLRNYTARVGNLRSMTLYGKDDKKISETINHYLHDGVDHSLIPPSEDPEYNDPLMDDAFEANAKFYEPRSRSEAGDQGVLYETFSEARYVRQNYGVRTGSFVNATAYHLLGVISQRLEFPSVQTGQTTINYKTGIKTSTKNLAFDFYSGQVTRSVVKDGYGNTFETEITPAYRVYPDMGLGAWGGVNALTQQAASYTYKMNPSNVNDRAGLVAATAQTWSDEIPVIHTGQLRSEAAAQDGVWRKRAQYTFVGDDGTGLRADGLYPANSVIAFDVWQAGAPVTHGWQKVSEITLYNSFSNMLEAVDINGRFGATRMSVDQTRVTSTASNASYGEFAYSGGENWPNAGDFGSEVVHLNTYTTNAHTGAKAVVAGANERAFSHTMNLSPGRTYVISVWASAPNAIIQYEVNGQATSNNKAKFVGRAGDWYLLEAEVGIHGTNPGTLTAWCTGNGASASFDDFRVSPRDAAMTSYVYNEWGELSHILDNNNLYTKYEYDGMGRLKATYRESFQRNYGNAGVVQTGTVDYHYGINNPFTVNITASRTGSTGSVLPAGIVSVKQGGTQTFEIQENCIDAKLQQVHIDGRKLNMNQMSTTLADGTVVQVSGRYLTFKNVQSPHSLSAQFGVSTVLGTVECLGYDTGNGNICYEGEYRYAYFNDCGEPINWVTVATKQGIPADLRPLAVDNCCTYNNPNTTCNCHH